MTIQNTTIRKAGPSQGNGVNVSFPFTFKVFASADVLVTYLDAIGTESSLVLSTDYTVALNADQNIAPGGTVTLLWTPATGTYITLTSQVSNTQNLALTNAGGFYPTSINDALDRIVIQVQQLAEQIARAAKAPLSGIGSLVPSSLVFGVDATGTPILSQLASISSTAVSTFMNGLLGLTSATAVQAALSVPSTTTVATDSQQQTNTSALTTGTSTAYIAAPTPSITTPTANTRLRVKFHLASGAAPTLTLGTVTAALQQYDATGALVTATLGLYQLTDVEYNGTVYIVLDPLTPVLPTQIQPIAASVAANALTISASALSLEFRSSTLTSGAVSFVKGTPANLVISSGSTLGTVSAQQSGIVVIAINNAGTIELAAVNIAGGTQLDETNLLTTVAEGGAGAADSATVVYSTTARTSVAYRILGVIRSTQSTAGTWATAPSTIQGVGGQALTAMSSLGYGQTWQTVTRNASTTYYNTTGKPIVWKTQYSAAGTVVVTVGAYTFPSFVTTGSFNINQPLFEVTIPVGMSYSYTGPVTTSSELR